MKELFKKFQRNFSKFCPYEIYKYCIGFIMGLVFCSLKTYYNNEVFTECINTTVKTITL